jgi:uncharacterized protein
MSRVDLLRQLQAADSAIDAGRQRLATIQATLKDRSEFEAARAEHARLAEARKQAEAEQRDLELQAATLRQQAGDVEKRLYSGAAGSAHDVQNLSRHSEQLQAQVRTQEERLLQAIGRAEEAATAHGDAEARLRTIVAERRRTEADLLEEGKALTRALQERQAERERLRGQLDAATLKSYDGLRRRLGGLAVAAVKQRTCQGCRVGLIAAVEQRLRNPDVVVNCQSCGRILYPAP